MPPGPAGLSQNKEIYISYFLQANLFGEEERESRKGDSVLRSLDESERISRSTVYKGERTLYCDHLPSCVDLEASVPPGFHLRK